MTTAEPRPRPRPRARGGRCGAAHTCGAARDRRQCVDRTLGGRGAVVEGPAAGATPRPPPSALPGDSCTQGRVARADTMSRRGDGATKVCGVPVHGRRTVVGEARPLAARERSWEERPSRGHTPPPLPHQTRPATFPCDERPPALVADGTRVERSWGAPWPAVTKRKQIDTHPCGRSGRRRAACRRAPARAASRQSPCSCRRS